jgi:hypothetical protein
MLRRNFLAGIGGLGLLAGTSALSGCALGGAAAALDAGPLLSTLLGNMAEGFGMQIGTDVTNIIAAEAKPAVQALFHNLNGMLKRSDLRKNRASVSPILAFAAGNLPSGAVSAFGSALWRTKDGEPGSQTKAWGADKKIYDVPTPAQLGVSLLAYQHLVQWREYLEHTGQCVSLAELTNRVNLLFAPSRSSIPTTSGVLNEHVTEASDYTYWTTDGGQVSISWQPQLDKANKKLSQISASYDKHDNGGIYDEVPVKDVTQQFKYEDLWQPAKGKTIALNAPPAHPSYHSNTQLPTGSGSVEGTFLVKNLGSARSVSGEATFSSGTLHGKFYLNLSGQQAADGWITPDKVLPTTMTYVPGDCAIYSGGDVQFFNGGVKARLAGPGGVVQAVLRFAAGVRAPGNFSGVLTVSPTS